MPYANVYSWVKKYLEYGKTGLSDSRGRRSSNIPKKDLTAEEKQALEIELLKAKMNVILVLFIRLLSVIFSNPICHIFLN